MESVIRNAVLEVLKNLGAEDVDFTVEHPREASNGEYATNVALVVAQKLRKSPREIAEQFRVALDGRISNIARVEIAGPGFINFHLTRDFFKEKIADAHTQGDAYGQNESLKGEEIIFEYTSPNLFKPLHVGNLVGNIVGESVSRLFEWGSAHVHRVNYPSDIGLTVAKGVWGLKKTSGDPKDINQIGEAYRIGNEAYEKGGEEKDAIEEVNRSLYRGDDAELNQLRAEGIETSRTHFTELCRKLGTTFDAEICESEASVPGTNIVREHIGDVFEESEGAVIFRGEAHGLHTRVFLNSQGLSTYEAKDLGNFALKHQKYPTWTQAFVVTGAEQTEYFKVLICALRLVFPDAKDKVIEHIKTGFLTLTTGKMSSRKGNVLTGESLLSDVEEEARSRAEQSRAKDFETLIEQIAVGALKYQILRHGIGQNIIFDKEKALSLEGDSGPYLMYTHARICSIEAKADEAGIIASTNVAPEKPYNIEKIVYQFPEIIAQAQEERAPHHLVTYLTHLAGEFNTFYAHEKIVDSGDEYAPYKLALAGSVRIILKNGLHLLGMKAPERM